MEEEKNAVTLQSLVSRGYFLEELPPPFNTEMLGAVAQEMYDYFEGLNNGVKKEFRETLPMTFSIPKVAWSRRKMSIPNPIQQIKLSKEIADHWEDIQEIYELSDFSSSKQIPDPSGKRATTAIDSFSKFKEKCLLDTFDKVYELKTDISKYFPTIYTHSIPWAIHSKEVAKANRQDDSYFGNNLDRAIREGQSGQTIGIPIGTDTSRIVAEILGCTFDKMLKDKFGTLSGFRFVDDCYFYFDTQAKAEEVFNYFQSILTDYGLDINEEKTKIRKLPFPFEKDWAIELSNFSLRESRSGQRTDIKNFVSLAFQLALKNRKESVLKFAIRKLYYTQIHEDNWPIFESLLFKMAMAEPVILPDVLTLLLTYKSHIDKRNLKKFLQSIIADHVYKGNEFEVAWALWIAKSFSITIKKTLAEQIFSSRDGISILLCLDLMKSDLLTDSVPLNVLENEFFKDGFTQEWWLVQYEALLKKWVRPRPTDLLSRNKYFGELKKRKVSFYDPSRQLQPIKFRKKYKVVMDKEEATKKEYSIAAEPSIKYLKYFGL